ncbi:MAG TPA: MDR family MFS transporter [Ilumatobacteraceae bacterium]|nr:MDR family MFS transporter [Ilumatobacteraceae bacterium]
MTVSFNVPGFTQRRLMVVLGALMLAVLLASLETSIIATALPTITGEFNGFESYAWVGTAYIVTSAIGTPVLGKLSDLHGRRRIFQVTMLIFLVGSILCGSSQSMGQLIAARAVQGLGGGGIQALAFAIIGDVIPPRERGRYVGYFTLAFVGSALLGPLVGGFIIENWSWPWIFYLNVPFAIVVSVVCHFALRLPFRRIDARLDYGGVALMSISIASLMIGLEEGRDGWTQQHVLALFAVAAVTLVLFIVVELHVAEPLIPPRLFTDRVILCCVLLGLCAGVVTYGAAQFLPLYFQDSLFVSPTESGLRMLPQMIGVTMATFGIGRLIAKTGRYKPFPIIGSIASVIGLLGVAQITGETSYAWLVMPMIFMGFGAASVFTTTSIASQNAAQMRDLGVVTATVMFFRSLGGSFGLAVFGTTLNATIRSEIPARTGVPPDEASSLIRSPEEIAALPADARSAVVDGVALGVSRIYLICAGVMACAVVIAILLPERPLRLRAGLSDAMEERATSGEGAAIAAAD